MGPKKDSVWDQFHEPYILEGGKAQKAICKLCQAVVGAVAARLPRVCDNTTSRAQSALD